MADNLSVYGADQLLATLAASAVWAQLHTGPPGAAGTSNVSSVTTRKQVTWGTPSGGAMSPTNTPSWTSWAGTNNEVETDISLWDASTGGNFWDSVELTGTWYAFTATQASPGVFTVPGPGYTSGQVVYLAPAAGSSLPGGFSAGTAYYVVSASGNTFQLSATLGGSGINATSAGAGLIAAAQPSSPVGTGDNLLLSSLAIALPVAA